MGKAMKSFRRAALLLVAAGMTLAAAPGLANDGGGGAPERTTPSASKPGRGKCDTLARLRVQLENAEDDVRLARIRLEGQRENMDNAKKQRASWMRKEDEKHLARATNELKEAREDRDRLKRDVERLARACL